MTTAVTPPPLPAKPEPIVLRPGWWGALRAIWLFTWRPQLTWSRLPVQFLSLIALPALVWLTIPSPTGWSQRHTGLVNPGQKVNELARRLARSGLQLRPEQQSQLYQIFTEESARLDRSPAQLQSGEAGAAARRQEFEACYRRIQDRVEPILNDQQFEQFRTFEKREIMLGQSRIRPTWGRAEPFYHWLIDLYFFVILPLQCVRACGGLIRDELQADTLGFLLTRPLSRARLLLLKYTAQTAWLEITLAVQTLLLFATGAFRQIPGLDSLLPLFLIIQILAVPAWSALGICLGQITKRYMPLALVYGLIVEMGIGRIPTNINNLSLIRHLKSLLAHNASLQSIYDWPTRSVPVSAVALLFAAALFVIIAAVLFTSLEYHQTSEMQK
jgi:hypothetical protein